MRFLLIRHAKTKGNLEGRYIGVTDEDILENTALDRIYPNADVIVSSPLKRCVETAKLIYPERDIELCRDFRETDFGEFENRSYDELKNDKRYIKWISGAAPPPCGETRAEFEKRCVSAYERIIFEHRGMNIACIVHGGTVMAVMRHIFGGDFYDYRAENLGGYEIITSPLSYTVL